MITTIEGGITAPKGFTASGVSCGIKKDGKKDLAIVTSEDVAVCAGVFTSNKIKGHSLKLTQEHFRSGYAQAIVINSGNSNSCVGITGEKDAKDMATFASSLLNCAPEHILVGSTGTIGVPLNMPLIRNGIRTCVTTLSADGSRSAAEAIITNDNLIKEVSVEISLQDTKVRIGGIAKGSSMIHPNMASMIGIITSDINIRPSLLQKALNEVCNRTFNTISTDGETSICDMVLCLANGACENEGIVKQNFEYDNFVEALESVCSALSKSIAKDGQGATKLIEILVENAVDETDAKIACNSISKSILVKTAIYEQNPSFGAIITALGNSDADIDPNLLDISIGNINVCKNCTTTSFDENMLKKVLSEKEIKIVVNLKKGIASHRLWTCDSSLTQTRNSTKKP